MTRNRIACMGLVIAALLCASHPALAEDAISHPAKKPIGASTNQMVPSLAVLNSKGATLQGNKLTLTGVSPNSIVFADRPVRAAGHVLTSHFIKEWDVGNDSFAKDPPNATISVLSDDGATVKDAVVVLNAPKLEGDNLTFDVSVLEGDLTNATISVLSNDGANVKDAVVVLKAPKLEGDNLTFDVSVLEGDLTNASGAAALFIDWFAARGYGGRAVVGGGPAWHGAWYGHPAAAFGAGVAVGAVGAAVTHPYYYGSPACGYYPYPPCY